jgi:hypothetical protein
MSASPAPSPNAAGAPFLGRLREPIEKAVYSEQGPCLPGFVSQPEPAVNPGIEYPSGQDHSLGTEAIAEHAAGHVPDHFAHMEEPPEKRKGRYGHPQLLGAEEEESIGRVAQGEEKEHP